MGLTVVGNDGVVKCPKCHSPMNVSKARKRYLKKCSQPASWEQEYPHFTSVTVGNCACGEHVYYFISK